MFKVVPGRLVKRLELVLTVKTLLLVVVVVYAASIPIGQKNVTGEQAAHTKVTNGLISKDSGFTKAGSSPTAAGTGCGSTIAFGSTPGNANTAVTAGNIVYDVQVNTTATAPASTCFTVTLVITNSAGAQTSYGPVYISTGASVTAGQTIDCKFDLGTTMLPSPPFSFKVTVQ